jgi:hypothetical protein
MTFWNTYIPTFSNEPYPDTVYGLGGSPVVSPTILNPSIYKYEFNIKFFLKQYPALLDQFFPGTINEHVYRKFEVVLTPESYRLFVMMGMRPIQNPDVPVIETLRITFDCSVDSRVFDGTNTTVTYNVSEPYLAPFAFDFGGVKSLYVYIETPVNSQFRAPFNQNDSSNLIARVPLTVPFGYQFEYAPQNVVYSQQKNLNISQMTLTCRDDYGTFIDFQNLPWFIELNVKFGSSEDELRASANTGNLNQVVSTPSLHPTAASYDSGNRDTLFGGQKNINDNTQRSKRFRQNG